MTTQRSSAPHRSAPTSRWRRASEVVLVVGTLVAVAAAFGPTWATRVGVGVAVAAAVVSCACAWRELFDAERRYARSTLQTAQRHGAQLSDERRRNAGVVDALTTRVRETVAVVEGQRVTVAALRHEVFSLEGDRTALRTAVADRDRTVTALRTTVQKQEVQLAGLQSRIEVLEQVDDVDADVHQLPRRVRTELDVVAGPSAVLDLRILPNYEEDRRFG